ncbi:MAG: hypothetical protein M1834_007018 [Cirrosporium novae-zelandiae]|nr:MAG: hypothetical protein M1834_007018 [Cirrosporium novae-zelandiae]
MKLDSAIIKSLSLDPTTSTVRNHGGSGFSTTAKITAPDPENPTKQKHYFMKTSRGDGARIMFEGEYTSLNAIHDVEPTLCPAAFAWGPCADSPASYYLVTDFLDMSPSPTTSSKGSGKSLAAKLAKLHTTPAPIPENYSEPVFGFPVTTCCGDTAQPNDFTPSWPDFYANNRLRAICAQAEHANGADPDLHRLVECMATKVVPRLLGPDHLNNGAPLTPVVIHGDLWSGNKGRGSIGNSTAVEDVVFDPSAYYGEHEVEHGMQRMFGGFGPSFWSEYNRLCPPLEPRGEYEDRVSLYELYHHLNHFAIFGGGYRGGAMSIMRGLERKYGK